MTKMTNKQKRFVVAKLIYISVNSLFFIGLLSLYGSLGALEVERIGYQQFIVQCMISLGMIVFSRYARYKIYVEE